MMRRRKRTRDRINAERREGNELIAHEEQQRQAWLAASHRRSEDGINTTPGRTPS